MGKRNVGTLAVTGITIAVAALFTVSTTAASAATTAASAPSHVTAPSAAEAPSGCVTETFTTADEPYYEACVADEQILLNDLYYQNPGGFVEYALTVDGSYGPLTAGDVTYFQEATNIEVDGRTGPQTWNQLCETTNGNGFHGTYWHDAGCATEPGL
jgi:peptidoglycan hydrolase-like protein with peptidoglycan-binding domain